MQQDPNNYWEQLERLEKLIRASELKAGIIFSFHSLILGLFVDRLENFKPLFESNYIPLVLVILWIIFVLLSIFYCFKCFKPHIEVKYDRNVFFFRDAVSKFGNTEEYTKHLMKTCANENILFEKLSEQIHVESKIIDNKFRCVNNSLKFFGISFAFVVLLLLYWIVFTL